MYTQDVTAKKGEKALDSWSWIHLASGLALGSTGIHAAWGVSLIVGFELVEGLLRRIPKRSRPRGGLFAYESWPNIFVDIAVGLIGYAAGRSLLSLTPYESWLTDFLAGL